MARPSPQATGHLPAPEPPPEPGLGSELYTGPFHAALRAAIQDRGLTLERLQSHLARQGIRVGVSTLSLWQHGHTRPSRGRSLQAVRALEEILRLPPGTLTALLAAGDASGPAAGWPGRRQEGLDEGGGPLGELLDDLPGSRDQTLEVLSLHQTMLVDGERRPRSIRSRTLFRARRDGVDRHVARYFGNPECDIERVQIRPGANCRLGEVRRHPSAPVLVAELLFDHVLAAGETWVLDDLIVGGTGVCTDLAHGFRHPEAQCLLEARFDPGALPARCHAYARSGLYTDRHRVGELRLNSHGTVHLAASDVRAGVLGIGWDWE
jgi:hypothetical protein